MGHYSLIVFFFCNFLLRSYFSLIAHCCWNVHIARVPFSFLRISFFCFTQELLFQGIVITISLRFSSVPHYIFSLFNFCLLEAWLPCVLELEGGGELGVSLFNLLLPTDWVPVFICHVIPALQCLEPPNAEPLGLFVFFKRKFSGLLWGGELCRQSSVGIYFFF